MTWKRTIVGAALMVGCSSLMFADPPSQPSDFSVTSKTKVPGLTLKPGSYTIRVVDRLSDRIIVRVDTPNGGPHVTFIGLQNPEIPKPSAPGLVSWTGAGENASYVRGWYFASIPSVVEFVYPKAEAVKIAQKTDVKVPAIDPASERRVADRDLSQDDLELVTLWLLSSTRVGPGSATPAIQAERYKQPQTEVASQPMAAPQTASVQAEAASNPTQMARVEPPTVRAAPAVASARKPKPVVAVLPKTGSELPLVGLLGSLSLCGGVALRRLVKRAA